MEHIIIYGKENTMKYEHAIDIIKSQSKSNLKYKRKIEISINDHNYYFNISDIHFEVDFELLGTNEYNIWVALYQQIQTICKEHMGRCIILCKQFNCIKDELLDIFYIFLRDPLIQFILCTKNISSLPDSIIKKCKIICLKGSKESLCINLCNPIVELIQNHNIDYFLIRELLYNLLTYNLNIHECFYYILNALIERNYINTHDITEHISSIHDIIEKYNNNYRTIYHLERFVMYLIILKRK